MAFFFTFFLFLFLLPLAFRFDGGFFCSLYYATFFQFVIKEQPFHFFARVFRIALFFFPVSAGLIGGFDDVG